MIRKGTPIISESNNETISIEGLDARYLNTGEKLNTNLNVGGNQIVNVIDSEEIITKTTILDNLESRRQRVDASLSSKVDRTLFDSKLEKKVDQTVFGPN